MILNGLFARLQNSISFRLTLHYGLLAITTTAVLVIVIYFQVMMALRAEYTRQITATAQRLAIVYEEGGRSQLVRAIELTLSDRIDSDRELYFLHDGRGVRLAGNIDTMPQVAWNSRGEAETSVLQEGRPVEAHLRMQSFAGKEALIVGHDLAELNEITSMIGQAAVFSVALGLLLVLLGTYVFKRELEFRVAHIRKTTQQVGAGRLSMRIAPSANQDEFCLLDRDINAMLDRIEVLMKSARHISDTIAHNLRTPLTRIMGRLRNAQRPDASREDLIEANTLAVEGIEGLNVLLGKLLQIAEIEAGVRRQTFRPCRLDSIATDVFEMYETLAEERGLTLRCATMMEVTVLGDVNLLASAVANLVDNAVKYATGAIVISVTVGERSLGQVVIQDDGPGLPADEHEHVGKHFYRLDSSAEGHGLGLTSVQGIVDLHGGTLCFLDAQPGLKAMVSVPMLVDKPAPG